jgi:hypothetical protein
VLVFFLFFLSNSAAHAQTYYAVRPPGACTSNGDGANWDCAASSGGAGAYVGLPSTLVRGSVYCLADGNYGGSLNLDTADSGTLTIELRKAQSYDSNCAGLAGWSTSTMGSAQAVWNWVHSGQIVVFGSDYWIINGNGNNAGTTEVGCGGVQANPPPFVSGGATNTPAPHPAACGILISDYTCTATSTNGCTGGVGVMGGHGNYITWESTEWLGQGNKTGNNAPEPYFWMVSSPLTGVVMSHNYMHNAGSTYFTICCGGWNNGSFDHNYVWGLYDSVNHAEAVQLQGNNSTDAIAHNIFRDQATNGDVVAVDSGTENAMSIYDNVDYCSTGANCNHTNGFIGCFYNSGNSNICTNYLVYNNTLSIPSGGCGWNLQASSDTAIIENNVMWDCSSSGSITNVSGVTSDYNVYLNSNQGVIGSHDYSSSSAANPFVNFQGGNFNLASDHSSTWGTRLSLSAPYNIDVYGNTYTTDRGAAQFDGTSVQPPTGLTASVQP